MKKSGSWMYWVGMIGLMSAAMGTAGCSGAEEGAQADTDDVASTTQAWTQMNWHGGGGGTLYSLAVSTDGRGYDGMRIRSGSYVDQVQFEYYSPPTWTSVYGGSGGDDQGQHVCSNWAIGIYGRAGSYIDQLGIICGNFDHSNKFDLGSWGGGGGDAFREECPAGEVIRQIEVRAGSYLDAIRIVCG